MIIKIKNKELPGYVREEETSFPDRSRPIAVRAFESLKCPLPWESREERDSLAALRYFHANDFLLLGK